MPIATTEDQQHVAQSVRSWIMRARPLATRCLTVAGGTSQVLLTLAGERLLGLPRG